MENKKIETQFKEKLGNRKLHPSRDLWSEIEGKIDIEPKLKNRSVTFYLSAAAASVLMLICVWSMIKFHNEPLDKIDQETAHIEEGQKALIIDNSNVKFSNVNPKIEEKVIKIKRVDKVNRQEYDVVTQQTKPIQWIEAKSAQNSKSDLTSSKLAPEFVQEKIISNEVDTPKLAEIDNNIDLKSSKLQLKKRRISIKSTMTSKELFADLDSGKNPILQVIQMIEDKSQPIVSAIANRNYTQSTIKSN